MNYLDPRVPHAAGKIFETFSQVGDAFAVNFEEDLEIGGAFAVMRAGELVVDIRGGYCDRKREEPWTDETLVCIHSSSKAVLAFLHSREASAGRLDYDERVAADWPSFGQNGKQEITLAELLSHQAGLCGFPDETDPRIWLDWDAVTRRLEEMAPLWPPGSASGYHPQTYGYLVGEVIRRASGKTVGAHLREFSAQHGLSLFCGITPEEASRAAVMRKPPRAPDLGDLNEFTQAAFLKPWSGVARIAEADWVAVEMPGSNMHADARSLARALHPLANGGRDETGAEVVSPVAIDALFAERIRGADLVLPFELSWSAGLMRNINGHFGPNDAAFGHAGSGGSCVVIDPENRLTAAYVMNKMSPDLVGDARAMRLINSVYAGL